MDLAIERVADRVKVGGHGIKEKDIRKRYESSLQNLQTAIQLCDEVYVYDNIVSFRQVAIFKEGVRLMNCLVSWNMPLRSEQPEILLVPYGLGWLDAGFE